VKISYRQAARDDLIRQFRYYLVDQDRPELALRFRESVRRTVQWLRQHPRVGPQYRPSPSRLQNLRSWPVAGFEVIRIYYVLEEDAVRVIRILHGTRDVTSILEREEALDPQ
jgi:plasmid stabilization system protein ParE